VGTRASADRERERAIGARGSPASKLVYAPLVTSDEAGGLLVACMRELVTHANAVLRDESS
jgi:hypothetical protein